MPGNTSFMPWLKKCVPWLKSCVPLGTHFLCQGTHLLSQGTQLLCQGTHFLSRNVNPTGYARYRLCTCYTTCNGHLSLRHENRYRNQIENSVNVSLLYWRHTRQQEVKSLNTLTSSIKYVVNKENVTNKVFVANQVFIENQLIIL